MSKRRKLVCDICYSEQRETKCNECTFECCFECIYEWSTKSHKCPQCGQIKTYDIEYEDTEVDEDSVYEFDLFGPLDDYESVATEDPNGQDQNQDQNQFDLGLFLFTLIPPPPPPPPPPPSPPLYEYEDDYEEID